MIEAALRTVEPLVLVLLCAKRRLNARWKLDHVRMHRSTVCGSARMAILVVQTVSEQTV